MTGNKIKLRYAEFYITNVCNLACPHCNRFNDYHFRGWQKWDDYREIYRRWAEYVDIEHLAILGGEPLLNPDIIDWCQGLQQIFRPNSDFGVDIITNGYYINRVKGLYDVVKKGHAFLFISLHNPDEKPFIFQEVQKFIGDDAEIQKDDLNSQWFVRDGQLKIFIVPQWNFSTSAVLRRADGGLTLHNSDPVKAHSVCSFALSKNYHFIKGKFYKCGPVALLPEFDQQFDLDISAGDRELLNAYQPLTVEDFPSRSAEFFRTLDDPIAQCKFCPASNDWRPLVALPKSSKAFR